MLLVVGWQAELGEDPLGGFSPHLVTSCRQLSTAA